ncbi:hypothetical protein I6F26_14720 [Ensifer sp. IC3342]|nr:hypothetical protein [Ensifer sp. BRP08]MCA1447832.1 hypothetical protein [Ensifer sp. IC3342]
MSPKSAERFWDNDMRKTKDAWSPKSAQRFWDNDMRKTKDACRPKVRSGFGIAT